jgi:riboflavin kinase / FMN adenylyltransferase
MIVVRSNEPLPPIKRSVVSVGNFDGVHEGHRVLIETVVHRARELKATAVIVTFEPHTKAVINPSAPLHMLTTCAEKEILIRPLGPEFLICLPFTRELSALSPDKFLQSVLVEKYKAIEWVMGENHAFGKNREGSQDFLRRQQGIKHFNTFAVALSAQQKDAISSTRIRARLVEGKIREAVEMLGHPYLIVAQRTRGTRTGTAIGFPTLNFKLPPSHKVIPPPGVYAAQLEAGNNWWTGALYIGNCPTFADRDYHLEFHALSGPAEHPAEREQASVWVHAFIRKDETFDSSDDLVSRIHQDISQIRDFFNKE